MNTGPTLPNAPYGDVAMWARYMREFELSKLAERLV